MRSRNSGAMMRQDMSWGDEAQAQLAAASRKRGDAYLKYWAAWAKHDPTRPRLARSSVVYVGRYDEPEKLKLRPEAKGDWMDDLADAVGCMVLAMPPKEKEAVLAVYLRLKLRRSGNAEWAEHIRVWKDEDCAGWLRVDRATMYRRVGRARQRVENLAEQMNLVDAPDLGY